MKNHKLHTKKRTYFFNFYENGKGNDLVEIIESQFIKNGTVKRNKIIIFKKDLADFLEKLQDLIIDE